MKYVMIEAPLGEGLNQIVPVIFPNNLCHDQVSEAICALLKDAKPVSAGEIMIHVITAHGRSETLDLDALERDRARIDNIDYLSVYESDEEEIPPPILSDEQ